MEHREKQPFGKLRVNSRESCETQIRDQMTDNRGQKKKGILLWERLLAAIGTTSTI